MNTEQELRRCPFCGGEAVLDEFENDHIIGWFGRCLECNASMPYAISKPIAVKQWNRRSSDEQAEVVAWQWQQCKSAQPGVWPEQWNNIELRPGEDRVQYWRDLAEKIPDEVRVRSLYASPPAVAAGGVTALLDAYEAQVKLTPLGHENSQRGRSTYNWKMAVIAELRQLAALPTPPSRGEGV